MIIDLLRATTVRKPRTGVMRTVTLFDKVTGEIRGVLSAPEEVVERNVPDHCEYVEGAHDGRKRKVNVVTGVVEPYQPPAPDIDHVWNARSEEWELPLVVLQRRAEQVESMQKILTLEVQQARTTRELLLERGDLKVARDRLAVIDDEIAVLRTKL